MANRNEFIKKALEELERINNDPKKRELYEAREKELRDQISEINAARKEGEKEGEKKGEKKEKKKEQKRAIQILLEVY